MDGLFAIAIQEDQQGLIVFLAIISVVSWTVVGLTALVRFGVRMWYRAHQNLQPQTSEEGTPAE